MELSHKNIIWKLSIISVIYFHWIINIIIIMIIIIVIIIMNFCIRGI